MTSGSESSSFATPYHDQVVNKHFYLYEYQQLYLSVFLLSSHFTILFYLFFLKNARTSCIVYIYLAKPLSKVHVSNSRSNSDYDQQDILSHCRMHG